MNSLPDYLSKMKANDALVSARLEAQEAKVPLVRLTTPQAVAALRLLRLKMRHLSPFSFETHIQTIFWGKDNGQFFSATIQGMLNTTLSWDDAPGREDVILAIDLLLEFAKKDPKKFAYWYRVKQIEYIAKHIAQEALIETLAFLMRVCVNVFLAVYSLWKKAAKLKEKQFKT